MYDPRSGRAVMPRKVRTGQSKFGDFTQNRLPRMLSAGLAAATAPGDGSGGVLAALKGMQVGQDHLQKQDMLAYQTQRQRAQDAALEDSRRSQAEENRAQAEMYRAKMNAPVAAEKPHVPTSYAQVLVQRLLSETDPVKRAAIEKQLQAASLGSQPKNPQEEWSERARRSKEIGLKEGSDEWKHYMANGALPAARQPSTATGAVQWGESGKFGKQQAFIVKTDPVTGEVTSKPIVGLERDKPTRGGGRNQRDPNIGTKHDFLTVRNTKSAQLAKAEKEVREDIDKMGGLGSSSRVNTTGMSEEAAKAAMEADVAKRKADRWALHEQQKKQILADYYESVVALGGSVSEGRTNPIKAPGPITAPRPALTRELPSGLRSPFSVPGGMGAPEPWERFR
jgi:hypothetical protein